MSHRQGEANDSGPPEFLGALVEVAIERSAGHKEERFYGHTNCQEEFTTRVHPDGVGAYLGAVKERIRFVELRVETHYGHTRDDGSEYCASVYSGCSHWEGPSALPGGPLG